MKILLHCGVGNTDRPNRWRSINTIFSDLGESLLGLGHDVHIIVHPEARIPRNSSTPMKLTVTDKIDLNFLNLVNPDKVITWNGNSDGDRLLIDAVGGNKVIYGELGYFGHYNKTCYFDRCGVNTRHSMIGESFPYSSDTQLIMEKLIKIYQKPRLFSENTPYVFVPLQDETDTQITQYAPFKTMDAFLNHVFDIFRFSDKTILYKVHPKAKCGITLKHPKVIEVTNDVHHYLPYADFVFGLNSTVMVETLLYHGRIITYGAGVASRHFTSDLDRMAFVAELYKRQLAWDDLKDKMKVKNSHLYSILFT